MINKLTLKNFQAHKNSSLEFVNGLNVITGQSDQGKSSIIRALYWLFFNKPSGKEFISWNESKCLVKIVTESGEIARIRTKKDNRYRINKQNFDAVRSAVPDEIKDIINITQTNLQLQDEPLFLISQQPGEIARQLNDVVGLTKVDSSLQYVNKIIRKENTAINFLEQDIADKKTELLKYKNLKTAINLWDRNFKKETQFEELSQKILKLNQLIINIEKLSPVLEIENTVNQIVKIFNSAKKLHTKIINAESKIQSIEQLLFKYGHANKLLNIKKPLILKLDSKFSTYKKYLDKITKLQIAQKQIAQLISKLDYYNQEIKKHSIKKKEFEKQLNDLKKEVKVCPICNRTF